MPNHDQIAKRWVDRCLGSEKPAYPRKSNVFEDGNSIYSFGYHFEMARILRNKAGKPIMFLINGDTFSSRTGRQQSVVRSAIAKSKMPSVIIPHRALRSAGIDLDSIRIVHVTADRLEQWTETHRTQPAGSRWRNDVVYDSYAKYETRQLIGPSRYNWGGTLGTVEVLTKPAVTHIERRLYTSAYSNYTWDVNLQGSETTYSIQRYRHWLGESVISGEVRYRDRKTGASHSRRSLYLSGFDMAETRPAYFFCELPPRTKATTVAEAYESLKPATVKFAESIGREVKRQGDVFAVPTEFDKRTLRKRGATFTKGAHVLGTNHKATEMAMLPDGLTLVRGTLTHAPDGRRPDHKRVTVGKQFHVVLKNTVPVAV